MKTKLTNTLRGKERKKRTKEEKQKAKEKRKDIPLESVLPLQKLRA